MVALKLIKVIWRYLPSRRRLKASKEYYGGDSRTCFGDLP